VYKIHIFSDKKGYNKRMKKIIIVIIIIGLGIYFIGGKEAQVDPAAQVPEAEQAADLVEEEIGTLEAESGELDAELDELEALDFE
jgi:hypothetical protein